MRTNRPWAFLHTATLLCLLAGTTPIFAADAPAPALRDPPARASAVRGGPMSAADQAEVAKLADFPPWTPGAGDGNYSIGPDYSSCPRADGQGWRAQGQGGQLYDERRRQQVLSARRSARGESHPQGDGLHPQPIRSRHARPIHRLGATPTARGRNQLPNVLDNMIAEPSSAGDDRGDDRQWRR